MAKEEMVTVVKDGIGRIIPRSRLDEFKALGFEENKVEKTVNPQTTQK